MQRKLFVAAGVGLLLASVSPVASAQPDPGGADAQLRQLAAGGQVADKATDGRPDGVNPYLALVPDPAAIDYAAWQDWMADQADQKAAARDELKQGLATADGNGNGKGKGGPKGGDDDPLVVAEQEATGTLGANDTTDTAEVVDGFGTGKKDNNAAMVTGNLAATAVDPVAIDPGVEDDGSIDLATDTGIDAVYEAVSVTGTVGDGPHGSTGDGLGDYDYYAVTAQAGQVILADIDTPVGSLDPMLALWDDQGNLVDFNDDSDGLDSLITFRVPTDGTYYVMTTGFPSLPADPFDSASGDGGGSEGAYELTMAATEVDVDVYGFDLVPGDVLGAVVDGGADMVSILDPSGDLVMGSQQDASSIYAPESPLPGGGNALADHVADEAGLHYVMVSNGSGAYDLTVEAYRPGLEGNRPTQTLFLDFDGQRVNTAIWGGPGTRDLSAFRDFITDWGLDPSDEDALIDTIVATVEENVQADLEASGLNKHFTVDVTNSRDDRDTFGANNVSRVIVGGTIAESGISTIGVAQSIDPGNFGTEESAVVLLDVLSGPDFDDASLNFYIGPDSDVVDFVGTAVGNVTSHEAGHFFGNWHVDQFNDTLNLMDQGGNFPLLYGVGDDGIGGTADDPDVDFAEDTFNPNEGFTGTEDTRSRVAEVLTK